MTTLILHPLSFADELATPRPLPDRCVVDDTGEARRGSSRWLRRSLLTAVLMAPALAPVLTPGVQAAEGVAMSAVQSATTLRHVPEDTPGDTPASTSADALGDARQQTSSDRAPGNSHDIITPEEELLGRMETVDSMRIVMHALAPADRLSNQVSSLLTALGATRVEQRIVTEVPEHNQVRYYHPADREAGQVVGDALSLVFDDVAVRDFGDYQPAPSEGLIEIWLR